MYISFITCILISGPTLPSSSHHAYTFWYTKFETNDYQFLLHKCAIAELTQTTATTMKKKITFFFFIWMNDQFISIETNVQLVQNTTKQYNTNTETTYAAP